MDILVPAHMSRASQVTLAHDKEILRLNQALADAQRRALQANAAADLYARALRIAREGLDNLIQCPMAAQRDAYNEVLAALHEALSA
jgi:hypothetical protein